MHRKQLIKKFLRNECSAEEAELVMRYLEEEPSLLDEMVAKHEWDEVPANRLIDPDVDEVMRRVVKAKTSAPRLRRMMAIAVAACIAGLMFLAYLMPINRQKTGQVADAAIQLRELANTTSAVQKHSLPDGSVVELYPGGIIHFENGFPGNRNIYLKGKAGFDVVKNEQKPFVVYASDITTTALGTHFIVTEAENKAVEVQLFEGKVAVRSVARGIKMNDVYLTPGKQCRIDLQSLTVSVMMIPHLKLARPALPAEQPVKAEVVTEADKGIATLSFVKMPVGKLFRQLEQIYAVKIDYTVKQVEGAYFTGSFKPGSPINTVLDIVCSMNGLSWQIINDTIRISKSTQDEVADGHTQRPFNSSASVPITSINKIIQIPQAGDIAVNTAAPERLRPMTYYVLEDGTILFNKSKLADALKILQRTKAAKIDFFEHEIDHVYITGSVDYNSSLEQALTAICTMNGLRLNIENEQFVIRRN